MLSRLRPVLGPSVLLLGIFLTSGCGDGSEPAIDAGADATSDDAAAEAATDAPAEAATDAPAEAATDGGAGDSGGTDGGGADSAATDAPATDGGAGDSAATDAPATDGGAGDSAATDASFTAPTLFEALKSYVWVFGMLPGFKHVTYVRFDTADGRNGAAYYFNRTVDKYSGYYTWPSECGNIGLFSADATTREVVLQLPGGCSADAGLSSVTLTFDKFAPSDGVPAPRAKLESGAAESVGGSIEAYAFSPDICDKTLTTCEDVLK
jgi:hypothetical protein